MARIYSNRPAPSANKAIRPAVETKTDPDANATATAETTAAANAAEADSKPKGRPKKDEGSK